MALVGLDIVVLVQCGLEFVLAGACIHHAFSSLPLPATTPTHHLSPLLPCLPSTYERKERKLAVCAFCHLPLPTTARYQPVWKSCEHSRCSSCILPSPFTAYYPFICCCCLSSKKLHAPSPSQLHVPLTFHTPTVVLSLVCRHACSSGNFNKKQKLAPAYQKLVVVLLCVASSRACVCDWCLVASDTHAAFSHLLLQKASLPPSMHGLVLAFSFCLPLFGSSGSCCCCCTRALLLRALFGLAFCIFGILPASSLPTLLHLLHLSLPCYYYSNIPMYM